MKGMPVVVALILFGCSGENPFILQSIELHESAMKTSKEVVVRIQKMNSLGGKLEAPDKEALVILKQDFIDWESSIVEIPGHEHDHVDSHGHAGHDHSHEAPPDLTPEMLVEIQREMKRNIEELDLRSKKLLDQLSQKQGK